MKGVIDDYFGQSSKGNENVISQTDNGIAKFQPTSEEAAVKEVDDSLVSDGKENVKAKGKMLKNTASKVKSRKSTSKSALQVKKVVQKKSLSTKKPNLKEEPESSAVVNAKDNVVEGSSPIPNFNLRIRIKSKEQEDKDNFIDDFSSPEHTDGKSKDLKSPQGSMFKYLVSPKNVPHVGNEGTSVMQSKANRDILNYFSPNEKCTNTLPAAPSMELTSEQDRTKDNEAKKLSSQEPQAEETTNSKKKTTKPRSGKKSKASALSKSKMSEIKDTSDKTEVVKVSNRSATGRMRVKAKPSKKSLSLTKNDTDSLVVKPPLCPEGTNLLESDSQGLSVTKSVNNAFQAIMSKASLNKTDSHQSVLDIFSKKRKRDKDDDNNSDQPCKTVKEDSPVKSKKRQSNANQIESDSDNDIPNSIDTKTSEAFFDIHQISKIENHAESVDALPKLEESKRNSLMSYFSKVTKEEALAKEDKIEMKVQAMVHSPPTTPSKKAKRRSVNSLPGGALSLSKKKINVKAKLREDMNAIEVIDIEETKGIDVKIKDSSCSTTGKQSPSVSKSSKSQTSKTPQNAVLLKTTESSIAKIEPSKSAKKSLSRGKGKQETNIRPESNIGLVKSCENNEVDEDCLAVPFPESQDEAVSETPQIPVTKEQWKMRVCLTSAQIPSTQETMLEVDSDCEIFAQRPDKKRKLNKNSVTSKTNATGKEILHEDRSQSPEIIFDKETKQSVKIAPLFTRKADTEARQLFLQSGAPDQVKRALETQRSYEEQETDLFPKESHIQQRNDAEWTWNLPDVELPLKADSVEELSLFSSKFSLSDITGCCDIIEEFNHIESTSCKGPVMRPAFGLPLDVMKPILRLIKQESTDFKVVNTFKVLRSKLREEEFAKTAAILAILETEKPKRKSLNRKSINSKQAQLVSSMHARCWTEKYKPCTASEIVGNGASIQQLKRWLESWRKACEDSCNKSFSKDEVKRRKKRKDALNDDDDFLASDNSSDAAQNNFPVGVAVLCGPNGSGKTSSVYALAKDLGYKVLEVNASEKRNGKLVLSKLSEATQSHQVQQGTTAEQGFAALFGSKSAKNKKPSSKVTKPGNDGEDDKTKKMSLILFEDVDIVFDEEDEGFLSAISTLVSTSKRPVILTTTDPESPMVHRFMNSASVVLPFSCSSNLITVWLQIVSLLEGVYVAPATVKDLVSLCKGDFRRAILQMQLWVSTGGNNLPMPSITYVQRGRKSKKSSNNGENDDMSDLEGDSNNHDCSPCIPANTDCIAPMLGKNDVFENSAESALRIKVPFPLDVGLFWWNIPPLLSLEQLKHAELPVIKEDTPTPALGSGSKRILDESFIASFCTDDGTTTDSSSAVNDDSDAPSSQATSVGDTGDMQDTQYYSSNPNQSNVGPIPYTSTCSQEEMFSLYYPFGALSFIDVMGHSCQPKISTNVEPITRFANSTLKDSLSLTKLEVDGPNFVLNSITQDISHWLSEQSLNQARACLCAGKTIASSYSYSLPHEDEYRWREAHAKTEQAALQAVPLNVQLDRQALSTDYMPILRIFCRLERNRSCINTKRRNRFFHHLKSLGAHLDEAQLELLCRSMCDR